MTATTKVLEPDDNAPSQKSEEFRTYGCRLLPAIIEEGVYHGIEKKRRVHYTSFLEF